MLTRGTLIYLSQRMVLIVFTVLAVSSIVFLGIHRLPGDALFNEHLHGVQYQNVLHHYGLDKPLFEQYTPRSPWRNMPPRKLAPQRDGRLAQHKRCNPDVLVDERLGYPGESHVMFMNGRPDPRVDRLAHIVGWFEKHLGPTHTSSS